MTRDLPQSEDIAAPVVPHLAMLPTPRAAYYTYGDDQRQDYTVLGFALDAPAEPREAADLYHATYLLVLKSNGKPTWLSLGRLIFEPLEPSR